MALAGQQGRRRVVRTYVRTADYSVSTTDPDATHLPLRDGVRLGYQGHYVVDGGKARIILGALATPGEVPEERPALDLLWRARFRWGLHPHQATGDKSYGTLEIVRALEEQGLRAYVLLPERAHAAPFFSKDAFRYDPATDAYSCPGGATLPFRSVDRPRALRLYRAPAATCAACALRSRCTTREQGRLVTRAADEAFLDRVRAYQETEAYHKARRKRSMWVGPLFAEAKDWHGLRRCRLRRLWRVNVQVLWTASGQNLKRLLGRAGVGSAPLPGRAGAASGPSTAPAPRVVEPLRRRGAC